jgi:hypothetical protein
MKNAKRFFVETNKHVYLLERRKNFVLLRKIVSKKRNIQMNKQKTFKGSAYFLKENCFVLIDGNTEVIRIPNASVYEKIRPRLLNN